MNDHALASRRRRDVLRSLLCGAAAMSGVGRITESFARTGFVVPEGSADASTAARFWAQPRVLKIWRPKTGESVEACFWRDGRLDTEGYLRLCRLMRDAQANQAVTMDVRLLNLLFGMQGWLREAQGVNEHYQLNSGYRNEHTNANTEGSAKNSLHMKGQAADGKFPSLPVEYVGKLQIAFQSGGTGIYLNRYKFIHSDVGRVRQWRG